MTTATAQIVENLNTAFAALDAEVEARSIVWIEGRAAALREFIASDEAKELRNNAWKLYERRFNICGGKTWHGVITTRGPAGRAQFMQKNCAATVAKRNAMIARKLDKAGVTALVESNFAHSTDGFDGTFAVETNKGRKIVTVNTIRAGGYNVQCLHLRVLVKVR